MVKIVCWNIGRNQMAWAELLRMRDEDGVDVALLQEVNPNSVPDSVEIGPYHSWLNDSYDRWPMVVKLSDKVKIDWFKPVTILAGTVDDTEIAVSDIRTLAAARLTPLLSGQAFIAFSMYARWLSPHPLAVKAADHRENGMRQIRIYSDASAHRVISDLSAFVGHTNPSTHRILAAGDLNAIYGATVDNKLEDRSRMLTVFDRMDALGLKFIGPQWSDVCEQADRRAKPVPQGLPEDTGNVPTYYTTKRTPATAENQLDYVFASKGFDKSVTAYAMNDSANWGPSDHCRIWIEVQ